MKHLTLAPAPAPTQESDASLQDLIEPGLSAVFCGLNPGRQAAASGHHFAGHGNRFWRTIHLAGFTDRELRPAECGQFLSYGFGLATVVSRATASASELSHREYIDASQQLAQKLDRFHPRYIAFLGKAAYAAITHQREIRWGSQPKPIGASKVWLLPNPSGRNRGFSLDDLVNAYGELRLTLNQ